MKKSIEGELFHEVEVLGNQNYTHLGFRDEKNSFGDMLASLVPEVGTTRKVKITLEVLGEIEKSKQKKPPIRSFFDKKNIFAVIGASKDVKKYGNTVFKDLIKAGYKTYAINPNITLIENHKVYPSLKDLPEKPDVAVFVVPPKITEEIIKTTKELEIKKVWMQPGSESKKSIEFCKENNIELKANQCIMVNRINGQ